MFPIYDDNPRQNLPIVTWSLMAVSIAVWLWQAQLGPDGMQEAVFSLGFIPAILFGQTSLSPELTVVPAWATIFTSMFMHGSWMHVGGNMLYLWIFGDNVENSMGRFRYLIFYLLTGVAAAMGQALSAPGSQIPMVGASGAISGVLGAYLLLHPRANVRTLIFFFPFIRLIYIPALVVLGLWFVMQVLGGLSTPGDQGGVAFWAHAGGFVAGAALIPFFKFAHVRLWASAHSRAFKVEKPAGLADVASPRGPSGGWRTAPRRPSDGPASPRSAQPGGRGDPLDPNFAPREWRAPSAPSGGQRKPAERAPQTPRPKEPPRDPQRGEPPKGPWG
jgi:membrane associated rhomboid family serine protease